MPVDFSKPEPTKTGVPLIEVTPEMLDAAETVFDDWRGDAQEV